MLYICAQAPNVTAFNTVNVDDDDKLIDVDLFEDSFGFGPSGLGEVIIVEPDTKNETDTVYNPITVVPKPPQPKFYNAFLERTPIEFLVDFIIEQDIGRNNPRIEKRVCLTSATKSLCMYIHVRLKCCTV